MGAGKTMLGARIKELRRQAGLSQDQLAERVGIDGKYLSRIEVGKRYPSLDTLEKMASALKVQMKELFDYNHFEEGAATEAGIDALLKSADVERLRLLHRIITAVLK